MMKTLEEYISDANSSTSSAELSLDGDIQINQVYPYQGFTDEQVSPSIVACATVQKRMFDNKGRPVKDPVTGMGIVETFTTMLAFRIAAGVPEWSIWCRDKFVEGVKDTANAVSARIQMCADCAPLAKRAGLVKDMQKLEGSRPVSNSCDFWPEYKKTGTLCEHTLFFLRQLQKAQPKFKEDTEAEYDFVFGIPSAVAKAKDFDFERVVFKTPVGIKGEQGAGKTYDAFQLSKKHGLPLYLVAGHEGVEARDLLGHLVPHAKDLVWKDGGVAAAFRGAQTGKVLMVIDEILRIPTREQTLLLTALTPLDGHYYLRTGRMTAVVDGVGKEEELVVPTQNLLVLATTNVGSQFAVNEMDPAMEERFVWFYRRTEEAKLRKILAAEMHLKGYSAAKVNPLVKFFMKMKELKSKGMVRATPSTRPLVRAIQLCDAESEIPNALKTQMLYWVSDNAEGEPIPEQLKSVMELIDALFK